MFLLQVWLFAGTVQAPSSVGEQWREKKHQKSEDVSLGHAEDGNPEMALGSCALKLVPQVCSQAPATRPLRHVLVFLSPRAQPLTLPTTSFWQLSRPWGAGQSGAPLGIMVMKEKGLMPGWVHQRLVGMGPLRGNCGGEAR